MRTLVFCTAFAGASDTWQLRYRRWLDAVQTMGLQLDQILIVDDGSSILPDWQDATIITESDTPGAEHLVCSDPVVVFHFSSSLGRREIYDFPGWYRSFAFAARYADARGFHKVIHLESDAYLISPRLISYVNAASRGWNVLWCQQYDMPEMAIQFIVGEGVSTLAGFFRQDYSNLVGRRHETMLPYTRVLRSFVGDRFGDYGLCDIPRGVDYAAQVDTHRESSYYWWLHSSRSTGSRALPTVLGANRWAENIGYRAADFAIEFGESGNSRQYIQSGWSDPEEAHTWAVGLESEIRLPRFPPGEYLLLLLMGAHVDQELTRQRLRIELNGQVIADLEVASEVKLGIELSRPALNETTENYLRFVHPDAAVPSYGDERQLSVAMMKLVLRNTSQPAIERSRAVAWPDIQCGVHIAGAGDLWFMPDQWVGLRRTGRGIQGLILSPGPAIDADELEYSAEFADGSYTEWVRGGEFCGTRGERGPLTGLRVRLIGDCRRRFRAILAARFTDGSELGPFGGAEVTCSKSRSALEAFRLLLLPAVASKRSLSATTRRC